MLDLAGVMALIAMKALAPHALLGDGTGGMDTGNRADCRRGGEGWVEYGYLGSANGNRATGVEARLDRGYLDTHKGTPTGREIKPPGYQWARAYLGHLGGLKTSSAINACHLLGSDLTGSGTDLRNPASCSRQANTQVRGDGRIGDHMFSYESQVKAAVDSGQVIHCSVTPRHSGAYTVPVSFDITAEANIPDGSPGIAFKQTVPNSVYSPREDWKNLGLVTDSRTGLPVPTGSLP
ncbi:DNA/RNA non-specific endonuclease [Streptomyces sp. NPDC047017]|uniref:DNA/RNA non-specific endonuclease n=1 Tax=Streptomyces sp. NPDC047017 TaxID=3155024 RepID=UPI0034029B37